MTGPDHPPPTRHRRIRDGLDRIAAVVRGEAWRAAEALGLTATQLRALTLLSARAGGLRVRDLAAQLGVSQPTATDSVTALERKGLVTKLPDPDDARAVRLRLSEAGDAIVRGLDHATTDLDRALGTLPPARLDALHDAVVATIRALQEAGAIPAQRMCVTCSYFRPHASGDPAAPHFCAFVRAALPTRDLRLDCGEHDAADPARQAATWQAFSGAADLRAPPPTEKGT
jgi:DNA-binding MarR family transcriptional regulator